MGRLSMFFVADLHLAIFLYIFALARGAFWCSSFFIHQSPTPQKRLFHPKIGCHSARMALQKGPSGLPSVPLLRCCLGRVRKWMERMDLMSRMERDGKKDSEKCRVRLFHNLSKFHAIYGILSIIGHFDRLITFNLIYHLSSLVYRFKWLSLQLK